MKVLVANRGEIAVRIIRACQELEFPTVAVYSDADREALHTRIADEALWIGPSRAEDSYLNSQAVLDAASKSGADAIHPGYGFLSENMAFAQAVEDAGLIFVGPTPETIALTGNKLAARRIARDAGLPVPPGPDTLVAEELPAGFVDQVHFPVLIKAVAGGGGRGIRLANSPDELEQMIGAARKEAQAAFGDHTVYLEPLIQNARHIEVQVAGDGKGSILYLGDRECSIQRRRQKLVEEAPAPGLSSPLRRRIQDAAMKLAHALQYRSLGTIEFLLDHQGQFFFIEVNPRIQVEHPVTEMVTGVDLVQLQLRLAASGELPYKQNEIISRGSAVETRVLAEDAENGFMPVTGQITHLSVPGGPGIRVDSALYLGMPVTSDYDSLIAKVIAWGSDRPGAIMRMKRALQEFQIGGVPTDLELLTQIVSSSGFNAGRTDTTYLESFDPQPLHQEEELEREVAVVAALLAHQAVGKQTAATKTQTSSWRTAAWQEQMH